jgi:hypothetical protein
MVEVSFALSSKRFSFLMMCSVSLLLFSKKNYYLLHWCNQQRQVCSLSFYLPPTVVGDRKKQKFANALLFFSFLQYCASLSTLFKTFIQLRHEEGLITSVMPISLFILGKREIPEIEHLKLTDIISRTF